MATKRSQPEHAGQVALFRWAAMMSVKHPELALLFAIPNGGQRNIVTAAKMKAEGVKRGVPDMFLPVPKHGPLTGLQLMGVPIDSHWGLFIEMKVGKNDLTPHQRWWKALLEQQGYAYVVAHSWVEAARAICDYLNIEPEGL